MRVFKTLKYIFFIVFIALSISFFDVQKANAYFQFTKTVSTSFTMATYQNLSLATDSETYGLCNRTATILLTVGNTNAYNMGYTITFSNSGLTYTIDGAAATTYMLPSNGSKTHEIVVSGTTSTQSLTITVTPNSPYGSIHNKVVTFDLVCPVCTWGGVNSTNQYLKNGVTSTYTIDCTDASGITSDNLTSSAFTVSNTSLASVSGVTKSAITNGYRYTVSLLGKTGNGNVTISLKANTVKDTNSNGNALKTSGTIIVDNTAPTLTLDKEGVVEGFKGWNIGSASIDSNGYLGFASESSTSSYYYPVDESYYYWTFEATATSASTQYSPNGGWYSGTSYYDANFAAFTGSNGYSSNGQASSIPLNTWKAFAAGNYNYGTGLEYFSINLTSGSPYANATTKYRNFKMYGNIFARNKYTIKVTASDANNVVLRKYASGSQTVDYFTSSGTTFTSDSFDVTSNGTYTVYLKDTAGNETIKTIVINKIDNTAPAISNFAQNSAWGTTNTLTATATDSSAGIVAYAFTSTNEEPISWIIVNNTTSAKTVTNTVSSNGTYYVWFVDAAGNVSSSSTSVNKIDTGLPSCSWGTLSNVTATTTKTFDITCTDTLSGIQSATLTTSNFVSSDTSKATVTSVSAPVAVTNGYKYTVTTTGVAAGTFTLSLNAESVRDNATNSNAAATSGAISVVRNTASMTVSSATSSLTYGSSTGSVTYTYSGNATPTVVSSSPGVATVSINTTTKTITITPVTAGTSTITLSAGQTNQYNAISKTIAVTVNKRAVTITAGSTSRDYNGSALTYASCTGNNLVSGQTVTCTMTAASTITNVGSATNTINTRVIKSGSTDVTSNYTITNATGTLTITRLKSATTGSCNALTYNGASQTLASGAANASYSNNAGTNATSYTVTVTAGANYAFSDGSTSKTLGCSIGKRPITITAKAQSIIEGNSIATGVGQVTYTATSTNAGLASGHSLDAITLTPSTLNIGTGTITPSGAVIESSTITTNYSITYSTGVLTVLIPARTYTVTFYKNGAALIGGSTAEYVTRSCTIPAGNTSTTCAITTPTISGASATPNVIGWGTTPDSHTAATGTNSTLNVGNNGAYYAQTRSSQSSYSALFYRNTATTISGSSATSVTRSCSTTITYNGITTITTCDITAPSIEKSGYIILGWSTSATTPTALISQSSTMTLSGSTEVYYAITGWSGNNMCNVTGAVTNPYNSAQCIFRGDNPNNYVRFNNTNYRIMSSDSNGKIKFIWNDSTLTGLTSYTYASGAAYTLINSGTYYTGLSSEALSFIEPTIFNIGTVGFYTNTDKYISDVAPAEATNSSSYMSGLLQVSEFLYASTAGGCTSTTPWSTFNSSPYVCTSSNWLLTGYPLHFINNHTASRIKYLKSSKQISYDTSTVSATIKPVHGFKPSVVFISGTGTSADPYIPFLNPTSFTCSVTTPSGYDTSKALTIGVSSGVTLNASPYSWNNSTWTTSNSTSVTAAGTYRAYVRDVNGTTATCALQINSRKEYRYRDCLNENKTFTSWSYHSLTTVQNKSSCNYPHSAAEADYATWAKLWDNRSDDECPDFGFTAPCYLCDEWTRAVTCSSYDGSSWSGWSTNAATESSIKQVETRTTIGP